MFSRLFGRPKPKPKPLEAIGKLNESITMLNKKQEFIEKKIEREVITAKKYCKTNKRLALQSLKKKKLYEKQILDLDGMIFNLEQQKITLESATLNVEILNTMKTGATTMKNMSNGMTVDDVDDVVDDVREQMDIANEISEAVSQDFGFNVFDEDELEQELDELLDEDIQDVQDVKDINNDHNIINELDRINIPNTDLDKEKVKNKIKVGENSDSDSPDIDAELLRLEKEMLA